VDPREGRIRALQRVAYGADTTDAERARAVAELAELSEHTSDGTVAGSGRGTGTTEPVPATDAAPARSAAEPAPTEDPLRRTRLGRWGLGVGAIGLVFGVAIGWGIGQLLPADSTPSSTVDPSFAAVAGTPLDATDLLPLLGRLPTAAEAARVASVDAAIESETVALLATRADGPAAFLASTIDGDDVCLVLLMPSGPSRSACTVDGRLPIEGLRIVYYADGYGLVWAHLEPSGAIELGLSVPF
jgi:hypothetical protein